MSAPPIHIVVVEDIAPLRHLMVSLLTKEGHHVKGLESAEEIDDEGGNQLFDLLITDLNLPGENGLSLTRRFRQAQPTSGIIIVTAKDQVDDKVTGYEHGADIYLTKPIIPEELTAAVNAFARRHTALKRQALTSTPMLILDSHHLTLQNGEQIVSITHDEALILAGLARAPDHRLEPWQILECLKLEQDYSKAALEVRITRLRKKITKTGYTLPAIKKIRGSGYQLILTLDIL